MKFAELAIDRKNNLNLIRLLAATIVALSHSYYFTGQLAIEPLLLATGTTTLGYLAVFVFFVISGFLIAQSFERSKSIYSFVAARVLRIYPSMIVVLILSAYVLGPFFTALNLSEYIGRDEVRRYVEDNILFKLNQYLPEVFQNEGINGSMWTLRYEVYCYLLLLFAGVIGLLSNRGVLNGVMLILLLLYLKEPAGMLIIPSVWNAVIYVPVMGFAFGTLIYVNRHHIECRIFYLILSFVLYLIFRKHEWFHFVFVLTIGYSVLVIGFHKKLQLGLNITNDYSYGIYLYAFPVQQAIRHSISIQSPLLFFLLTMLITVPLAFMSWHFVEKPALQFKKRFVQ